MKNYKVTMLCNLLLLLTAIIWGFAFVAQSIGMNYVGPWTFVFTRFIIAAIVLLPVSRYSEKYYGDCVQQDKKLLWIGGMTCGLFLGLASVIQQIGILYTTVGKAGFITALYVIMVPLLGILFHKKPQGHIWFGVAGALTGLYMISIKEAMTIGLGDSMVLLCAFVFSLQIMAVDRFARELNPIKLSNMEFLFAALVGLVGMAIFEKPSLDGLMAAGGSILYAGVLSSAGAYTMQVVAQKYTDPTIASLLMCLESVFSAIGGALILHEEMTLREFSGCILVFISVVFVEVFPGLYRKNRK